MERSVLNTVMCRLVILALLLFLGACSTQDNKPSQGGASVTPAAELLPPAKKAALEEPPGPPVDLWDRVRRQLSMHTLHNGRIGAAREYYLKQSRYFDLVGLRAERYLYHLVEAVEARDMPIEIAMLPLVESALNPFAISNQKAAGLWQIMPGTADYLGMRRDWWFDARLDIRASTDHALDYLESLNKDFDGDWLLTLAAYNSGKGRVQRAIRRNKSRGMASDYWSLELPRETRRYVPRLIALSTIIAFNEALEVALPDIPNAPAFTAVATGGQIEMLRAAELAGLDLLELRSFNPGQLRWATAPQGTGDILVPVSVADALGVSLAALPDSERVTWQHYRIRRGDSLIRIAKTFDTQVGLLREVNNLKGNLIRAGDTLMIPDSAAWRASLALAQGGSTGVKRGYKVRRGDSLYEIAARFDVTIDDIISWNDLDPGRYLQPGQSLTLYLGGG
ncbi:LysM peptidoglycan-binding domain-containing protein [Congregibacter litoralis]|uniref:LysM repeat protein n=1 Tax=Congregibacter litoralis KT71 TaxID=314285 RepID=A4A342_9GAMM|nr:LysM peptidoglycan-binding domain-containing protein [Congregibacter litoralis]EAQ99107.2 LysM repeat protein [Congregibacter litoralis KT71]